jgi:hypothetical protein
MLPTYLKEQRCVADDDNLHVSFAAGQVTVRESWEQRTRYLKTDVRSDAQACAIAKLG